MKYHHPLKAHRAVNLSTMKHFGMSYETATELNMAECKDCSYENESQRNETCIKCSERAGTTFSELSQFSSIKTAVIQAASTSCFPPEIIFALISRLSVENGKLAGPGWRPCKIRSYKWEEKGCYGLMQIPYSQGPDVSVKGDSVQHFTEGIERLIEFTTRISSTFTSFNPTEQTRAGLAAYDAGIHAIRTKRK